MILFIIIIIIIIIIGCCINIFLLNCEVSVKSIQFQYY